MHYRTLGSTGPKVSTLCLGTVKFGNPTPDDECGRIVDRALDAGINIIDTAHVYGRSEEIIGEALRRNGKRESVLIASKIQPLRTDRTTIVEQTETSLRRLRTDRVDLMQLHRPNADIPIEESLRAFDDLIRAGKVRYIGSSGFKAWQVMEALWCAKDLGLRSFVSEQSVYSLLCRRIEDELVPMARTYGIGLLVWSPLGAGILTERYTRQSPPAHMEMTEQMWEVIETVRTLAREKACTASQLALAWCMAQPGVTGPIAGPRTLAQLEDNLGALDVTLTPEDLSRLDSVAVPGWTARRSWVGAEFSKSHAFRW
jgi:aryl-alcohol dehydrogenase-like predicted oxidoreductase